MGFPHDRILPPYEIAEQADGTHLATTTFPDRFSGVKGVIHGGIIAMFFDEVLGCVANHEKGAWWATARLQVEYRKPSLTEQPVSVKAHLVKREGRKCLVKGELYQDGALCAETEGLFVKVR